MTLDLPGELRLILAGGRLGAFWGGLGLLVLALLLWLYREERRLVTRRAGLGLLALRLASASLLVSCLFEPIAARTFRTTERGRVVVAVDTSSSMATADLGRPGPERARFARALGIPGEPPAEALTRRDVARALIAGSDSPVGRLARDHSVEAFAFARDTAPGSLDAIADTLKGAAARPDDPTSRATDWLPTLGEALKATAGGAPVLGVVLLTDGRRNGPGDATPVVDRLAARGVPVFPVLIGSTAPPVDAAIASLRAPDTVYQGDVATVEAVVKLDGAEGRAVPVFLERPGSPPLRQFAKEGQPGVRPTVTFRVPLNEVGSVPLTVTVGPLYGDTRPDNDRRAVTVRVADDKAKVLLVDGEARWEFRYLRNALARDPRVALEAVVFRQPRAGAGPEATYPSQLPPPGPSADSPDPLAGFDAIVLGDVDPADLPAEVWARLDGFVSHRGGTLVLNPGPRFAAALAASEPARKLMPVLDPGPAPPDPGASDPAHPSLPPGVAFEPDPAASADPGAWPMLQLAADTGESRLRWAGLPRLPWTFGGRAKPGATALATAGGDPSAVLLAAQAYGLGKVLWVGTDATWRWRFRVGDAYHHRFWGQVTRWSASEKLAAGNDRVRFGPRKARADEGTPVPIQARVSPTAGPLGPAPLLAARVVTAGGTEAAAVVPLRPVPGQPGNFEGAAPGLPAGSYLIRLDAPGLEGALRLDAPPPPEAPLAVTPSAGPEAVELAADRDPLERLARATGGKVLTDTEADALPDLLRARVRETSRTEETPLWDTPAALLLFVGVVTAEWVARKAVGLP